jgi:DNA end-binding protein Ku
MAARSIASLTLSFGLVSIPIKLYSATESAAAIRFKLMAAGGAPLRQQYVADEPPPIEAPAAVEGTAQASPMEEPFTQKPPAARARTEAGTESEAEADAPAPALTATAAKARDPASRVLDFPSPRQAPAPDTPPPSAPPAVVERAQMVKGYEFEKGRFVLFTADELKALESGSRQTIDIVSFIPERSVDPIYYDKAYFLAPDKRGAKPYHLLLRAMQDTGRCALAKWAFRSKEYVVQIRAAEGGLVLQQLLYAEEVRSLADLDIEPVDVGEAELQLAKRLIEQISSDSYDPTRFVDEEKQRILAAVEKKIAGQQIVAPQPAPAVAGGQVVDLIEALRASLRREPTADPVDKKLTKRPKLPLGERKPVKRATPRPADDAAPAKARAGKR